MPAVNTHAVENITMTPDGRCRVVNKDGGLETVTVATMLWRICKDIQALAADNTQANPSMPPEINPAGGAILKQPGSSELSPVIYDEHGPAMPGYETSGQPFGTGWPG